MAVRDNGPPYDLPLEEFKWRKWHTERGDNNAFAYRGYEDPAAELAELVEHGLHGRRPSDDRPIDSRERHALEVTRRADARMHEVAQEYERKGIDPEAPPTRAPYGSRPKRQKKRGVLASMRHLTDEQKQALREQFYGSP